jgi:anti-sigma regulatory factor (Ser/Thr protein kinase)
MTAAGYPGRDVFGMRLALTEAIQNAVQHGHRGNCVSLWRERSAR